LEWNGEKKTGRRSIGEFIRPVTNKMGKRVRAMSIECLPGWQFTRKSYLLIFDCRAINFALRDRHFDKGNNFE